MSANANGPFNERPPKLRNCGLPPGPKLPSVVQTLMFWRSPHAYLHACRRRYGPTFTIRPVGMPPLIFVTEPDDIRAIITAPADVLHAGAGAAVIAPLVGETSFMLAEERQHLAGRHAIMPAFHRRVIAEHAETVRETVNEELARWPRNAPFAAHPYLRALTLHVVLRSLFHKEDPRIRELRRELLPMLRITASLALQEPQLRVLPGWRAAWKDFQAHRAKVDELLSNLIANPSRSRHGMLALLLGASNPDGSQMSTRQIRDNLMSLILAGHETTAAQLAWALQLLAHNPKTCTRLVHALDQDDETYLTATIHEILRDRPVFLFTIPRVIRKPLQIGQTTHHPPAQLLGCIHLMHHDAGIYPNPHQFRPERFIDQTPRPRHWLPWGGGRKHCPGQHLATLEMHIVLRTLLTHASLTPASKTIEQARWRSVIVTPGNGSRIILAKRRT